MTTKTKNNIFSAILVAVTIGTVLFIIQMLGMLFTWLRFLTGVPFC